MGGRHEAAPHQETSLPTPRPPTPSHSWEKGRWEGEARPGLGPALTSATPTLVSGFAATLLMLFMSDVLLPIRLGRLSSIFCGREGEPSSSAQEQRPYPEALPTDSRQPQPRSDAAPLTPSFSPTPHTPLTFLLFCVLRKVMSSMVSTILSGPFMSWACWIRRLDKPPQRQPKGQEPTTVSPDGEKVPPRTKPRTPKRPPQTRPSSPDVVGKDSSAEDQSGHQEEQEEDKTGIHP